MNRKNLLLLSVIALSLTACKNFDAVIEENAKVAKQNALDRFNLSDVDRQVRDGEASSNPNACVNGLTLHSSGSDNVYVTTIVDIGGNRDHALLEDAFSGSVLSTKRCDLAPSAAQLTELANYIRNSGLCYGIAELTEDLEETGQFVDDAGYIPGGANADIDRLIRSIAGTKSNCVTSDEDISLPDDDSFDDSDPSDMEWDYDSVPDVNAPTPGDSDFDLGEDFDYGF